MIFASCFIGFADFTKPTCKVEDILNGYTGVDKKINKEREKNKKGRILEKNTSPKLEIQKVEIYKNHKLKIVLHGNAAIEYLKDNPGKKPSKELSTSGAEGYTGDYRIIWAFREGDTHLNKVLNTNNQLELTSEALKNFLFNIWSSIKKPVYPMLMAGFDSSSELAGEENMGNYSTNNIIEKHKEKWFYKTYEIEFTSESGETDWYKSLMVEMKEIEYSQEYKLWNKQTNDYNYIYTHYGNKIEAFVPKYYSDEKAAIEYITKPNFDLGFMKTVYYNGKTTEIGEEVPISHKKHTFNAENPSKVLVQ